MGKKGDWPVVKFIIAGTSTDGPRAKKILEEFPKELATRLFITAQAWDRDCSVKAAQMMLDLVGDKKLTTLMEAAMNAGKPEARLEKYKKSSKAR